MAFEPSINFWRVPGYRERVTREELRELLLNHPDVLRNSALCTWKHKHVGVGVYEIWLEEKA